MNLITNLRYCFSKVKYNYYSNKIAKEATASELISRVVGKELPKLSDNEVQNIINTYKDLCSKPDLRYWQLYKSLGIDNPFILSDAIYVTSILRVLNPIQLSLTLQNKNYYPYLLSGIKQPRVILNSMKGVVLNERGDCVNIKESINLLREAKDIIIKPSVGGCVGNGVRRFLLDSKMKDEDIIAIIHEYGSDYIVQERVKQSEQLSIFNETSLNTIRVCTLNMNGVTSVVNTMFRHGRNGAIVDNGGSGGICCGINQQGQFNGIAIDSKLNKYENTILGTRYSEASIPHVSKICEVAIASHQWYLPMIGFAGWDFALDENNNPILIEVNLSWPGIMLEQLSNGAPIFGNRTEEVLEYCRKRQSSLHWSEFSVSWL